MATLRPFRGLRYNTRDPLSVALVTAPPYDCISEEERDELYRTHPHNVVRLILGRQEPGDDDQQNKYTRAADLLRRWVEGGVLVRDPTPTLYFYQQRFELEGTMYLREGFFARLRLEEFGTGKVFPHEQTMSGPREDRLRLLRATKANLSAVFGLYPDSENRVTAMFHQAGLCEPVVQTVDGTGVIQRLFACSDPAMVWRIIDEMADKPVYIADGHHRYETALAYRAELAHAAGGLPDDHPANYVLMMCVAMQHPGLAILPTHRVLAGLKDFSTDRLRAATEEHFEWTEFTGGEATSTRMTAHLRTAGGHIFGLWTRDSSKGHLLRLRDENLMDSLAPEHSAAWRRLDPAILQRVILETDLPKAVSSTEGLQVTYVHLAKKAFDAVHEEEADAALILRPLPVSSLEAVAKEGERMPPKSTYFYPKVLSGLVINPLSD